jgi:outer membrane protein OmpA-like peptidoglycan-associated protein
MINIRSIFLSATVLFSLNVWSEEYTRVGEAGTFGIGFDEGLMSRVYILDNIALYGGIGYYVFGADSAGMQPINKISWKLGCEYLFMVYGRLHVSAFTEWREECYQGQTVIGPGGSSFRYDQWNTLFRGGIRPELFLLKNLSIDFKMGLAYIHHGPTQKINADGSGTESRKNSYDEFGVYFGRAPFLSTDQHILLNIGVTFYFTKHKTVPDVDTDGDGIVDRLDKCPNKAGIPELNGCPDPDTDGDGIADRLDKCPDKAGIPELEGCSDTDKDGDGIVDRLDKCPDQPGIAELKGCPDTDSDKDGIVDRLDKCINEPEDADGFQDADGCPDLDNDGDGIPDLSDNCANNPGVAENNGCPKTKEITRGQLVLKGVTFESGKATLLPSSYKILDEIAESFREWPEVKVEVQGHTDNVGKPENNKQLSQQRAETVRDYLIQRGVSSDRITAVGYGQERPIADNKTTSGRAQNRRVELNRID